jgi:hypothetical protein
MEAVRVMSSLKIFCDLHDLDERVMATTPFGEHPPTIDIVPGREFRGVVEAIRICGRYGRFGNNFYQLLNALIIARRLGCRELHIPFVEATPNSLPLTVEEITVTGPRLGNPVKPTLVGTFYAPIGFERLFEDFGSRFTVDTIERYVCPIFQGFMAGIEPLGPNVVAMNFRGGDVFAKDGSAHRWYVQPPASFYVTVFEHARRQFDVDRACLVFEDRSNPALERVAAELAEQHVPFTLQSADLSTDLRCLLGADHIVRPYGTFCEAIAMLSSHCRSFYSFRNFSTQYDMGSFPQSKVQELVWLRGARTILVVDKNHGYIPPREWRASDEQLALVKTYPQHLLETVEKSVAPYRVQHEGAAHVGPPIRAARLHRAPPGFEANERLSHAATVNLIPSSASFRVGWHPGAQSEEARVSVSTEVPFHQPGNAVMRHRVDGAAHVKEGNCGYFETPPLQPHTIYTAACSVWIRAEFAGHAVQICIGEWDGQVWGRADLARRNCWQRISCTVR